MPRIRKLCKVFKDLHHYDEFVSHWDSGWKVCRLCYVGSQPDGKLVSVVKHVHV